MVRFSDAPRYSYGWTQSFPGIRMVELIEASRFLYGGTIRGSPDSEWLDFQKHPGFRTVGFSEAP